tara:strand:+ start:671 stop:1378 length:708 start_codon:yes stop_codon:yes gene_type:complete
MPLPKLEVPTYELKVSSLRKKIEYRPFLVREEKILLTALEGDQHDMVRAMKQIIENCLITKINIDELPLFDLEYIFLQLRSKSVGETSDIQLTCQECDEGNKITIDLSKIELSTPEQTIDPNIMLTDSVGIVLKYPTSDMLRYIDLEENFNFDTTLDVLEHCVDTIFSGDDIFDLQDYTKEERSEFFQNLTQKQFQDIQLYFDNMPKLLHQVEFKCSACESEQSTELEGLQNFFG